MTYLKYGAIAVLIWLVLKGVSKAYDSTGSNLGTEAVVGRGWAAPLTQRNDTFAWAPPYGVARQ